MRSQFMFLVLVGSSTLLIPTTFGKSRVENPYETVDALERVKVGGLIAGIREGQVKNKVEAFRDAHAKEHGCVDTAELTIAFDPKLDAATKKKLQVGYFAKEGKVYKNVVIRFSPGPGNPVYDDREGGAQGMALKIPLSPEDQKKLLPVAGETEYYVDPKYYKTFDIVMINHNREFFVNHLDDYGSFFRASGEAAVLSQGKSKEEKKKISGEVIFKKYVMENPEKPRALEGALLKELGGITPMNNLLETYNSWVPSLLGKEAIKYEVAPVNAMKPSEYKVPASIKWEEDPNFSAKVIAYELGQKDHEFTLSVQLRKADFPSVEEGAGIWPADKSPYLQVAKIKIPKGSKFIDHKLCEAMSFNPAHASAEHYPIGGIQRARTGGEDDKGLFEGIYSAVHKARNISAGNKPL